MTDQHKTVTVSELVDKCMEFLNDCAFTLFNGSPDESKNDEEQDIEEWWVTAVTIALQRSSNLIWSLHTTNQKMTLELNRILKNDSHDEDSILSVLKECQEILSEV